MPHIPIIIDEIKSMHQCLAEAASLLTEAHEFAESNPNTATAMAYDDLVSEIGTARQSVCSATAALAEKLN